MVSNKALFDKASRRVTAPVFVSGEKKTLGVLLTGLDVAKELKLSTLYKAITVGRFLDSAGSREIVLGKKLAERINADIGDEVAVVGQGLDGSVANDLMKVVGYLDFGGGDLEESLAFTQFQTAQELMSMDSSQYHQLVSFDGENEELPVLSGVSVVKWSEILPEIGVSIRFIDNFTWIVSVIIVIVISLGLANTLMITFFEREQEFQSLNIIGAKTSWITTALAIEVFMMGTMAIFLGVICGHLATTFNYYYPVNIEIFTNGKPILMGGMTIKPLVKLYPVTKYYWQVPLLIYFFLLLTMIYPLARVIKRSKHAL
jgi:ABC-type lipoprotein release transport system permease subunit